MRGEEEESMRFNKKDLNILKNMYKLEQQMKPADRTVLLLANYNEKNENLDKELNNLCVVAQAMLGCSKIKSEFNKASRQRYYSLQSEEQAKQLGIKETLVKFSDGSSEHSKENLFMYECRKDGLQYRIITIPLGACLVNSNNEINARREAERNLDNKLTLLESSANTEEDIATVRISNQMEKKNFTGAALSLQKNYEQKIFTINHLCCSTIQNTSAYTVVYVTPTKSSDVCLKDVENLQKLFTFQKKGFGIFITNQDQEQIDIANESNLTIGYLTKRNELKNSLSAGNIPFTFKKEIFVQSKENQFTSQLLKVRLPTIGVISQNEQLSFVLKTKADDMGHLIHTAIFTLLSVFRQLHIKEQLLESEQFWGNFFNSSFLKKGQVAQLVSSTQIEMIPTLTFQELLKELGEEDGPYFDNSNSNEFNNCKLKTYFTQKNMKLLPGWNVILDKGFPVLTDRIRGLVILDEYNQIYNQFITEYNKLNLQSEQKTYIQNFLKTVLQLFLNPNTTEETYFKGDKAPIKLQEYFNFIRFLMVYVSKTHSLINSPQTYILKVKDVFGKMTTTNLQLLKSSLRLQNYFGDNDSRHFFEMLLRVIDHNEGSNRDLAIGLKLKLRFASVTRLIKGKIGRKGRRKMRVTNGKNITDAIGQLYLMLQEKLQLAPGRQIGFNWEQIDRLLGNLLEMVNEFHCAFFFHKKFDDHFRMRECALLGLSFQTGESYYERCMQYASYFVEVNKFQTANQFYQRAYSSAPNAEKAVAAKQGENNKENGTSDNYNARLKNFYETNKYSAFSNHEQHQVPEPIFQRLKVLKWNQDLQMCQEIQ